MKDWNSKAEWKARIAKNPIYQQLQAVEETLDEITRPTGVYHAVCLEGPPGVGKNNIVDTVFARHGITPRVGNPGSHLGLIDDFYAARRGFVLFDEADKLFDADQINILKKALDPVPANRVLVNNIKTPPNRPKTHLTGKPFRVRCKSVFLTNKELYDPKQFSKAAQPHLSAFISRVPVFSISRDVYALWEYTCYLAIVEDMLKRDHHALATANQALEYFTRTMWVTGDASPRRLREIAKRIRAHPTSWRVVLDSQLPPPELRGSGQIPEIPEIVLPKRPVISSRAGDLDPPASEPQALDAPHSVIQQAMAAELEDKLYTLATAHPDEAERLNLIEQITKLSPNLAALSQEYLNRELFAQARRVVAARQSANCERVT